MKRNQQTTLMIARTEKGDPVWRTDGKGRPFVISAEDGQTIIQMDFLWWYRWWPMKDRVRMLPKPHLSWRQVAIAEQKSRIILKALRNGPIYLDKGFLKGRNRKILTTKAISNTVLHWMEGCGIALTRRALTDGRTKIDIDVEQTQANKVT